MQFMRIHGACAANQRFSEKFVIRVIPRGAALQNLCQALDLCTKLGVPTTVLGAACYKTHSARKSLILNDFS